jgi:hypothetical protein
MYVDDIIRWILLERETFQARVVEKIKTKILCSPKFSWISCRLWDNVESYVRIRQAVDDSRTRPMRFTRRISTATDTGCHYLQLPAFPLLQWLRERAVVLCLFTSKCLQCKESVSTVNSLKTKRRRIYLKIQSVQRCKHFLSPLLKIQLMHLLCQLDKTKLKIKSH